MERKPVTASILEEIFAYKRLEIAHSRRVVPLESLVEQVKDSPPTLDFLGALKQAPRRPALIAEVKQRSPSRGQLAQQRGEQQRGVVLAAVGRVVRLEVEGQIQPVHGMRQAARDARKDGARPVGGIPVEEGDEDLAVHATA